MTHYTGQLAKDTSKHLKDLNNISTGSAGGVASQSEQRQWRLQRERLQEDFTNALNKFQAAQRQAAQKEKEVVKKSRNAGNKFISIDLWFYHKQISNIKSKIITSKMYFESSNSFIRNLIWILRSVLLIYIL